MRHKFDAIYQDVLQPFWEDSWEVRMTYLIRYEGVSARLAVATVDDEHFTVKALLVRAPGADIVELHSRPIRGLRSANEAIVLLLADVDCLVLELPPK